MKYFLRYKRVFGSIFLAFFFLTSSGFTVVVRHCTMAAVPECCADMQENAACSDRATTAGQSIHAAAITCYTNTVVSSLNTTPATVEKSLALKIFNNSSPTLFSGSQLFSNSPALHSFTTHFPQHTSPPSVEKRILLSSFLI